MHTPLTKVMRNPFSMLRCICWCSVALFAAALQPVRKVCLWCVCVCFVGGIACMCVFKHSDMLSYSLATGRVMVWSLVLFAFLLVTFYFCCASNAAWLLAQGTVYCKVTECQRTECLLCLMFVYVSMSPINKTGCTRCVNKSFSTSRNLMGLSLFLPVSECVSVALGVCVSGMGSDDVKTESEWLNKKY